MRVVSDSGEIWATARDGRTPNQQMVLPGQEALIADSVGTLSQ
jgi:hypothetical protein